MRHTFELFFDGIYEGALEVKSKCFRGATIADLDVGYLVVSDTGERFPLEDFPLQACHELCVVSLLAPLVKVNRAKPGHWPPSLSVDEKWMWREKRLV